MRRKRIKLSKAQQVENDTNKWLAKRDAAIEMLVKAMGHLVRLDRSTRRLQKAALHPVQKKIADKLNAATKRKPVEPDNIHHDAAVREITEGYQPQPTPPLKEGPRKGGRNPMRSSDRPPPPPPFRPSPPSGGSSVMPPPDAVHKRMTAMGFRPTKKPRRPQTTDGSPKGPMTATE